MATIEETFRGLAPPPHERELATIGDAEALRARRCLDAVLLVLSRRMGTDELDDVVLDAIGEAEAAGKDWSQSRRLAARELADRLFRGRR